MSYQNVETKSAKGMYANNKKLISTNEGVIMKQYIPQNRYFNNFWGI